MAQTMQEHHSLRSSAREKILEHLFVGELSKRLWQRSVHDVEVLRSEVDDSGYDIVLEHADVVRHVQLKSSFRGARTNRQTTSQKLQQKPNGCVVWIVFDPDTLELGPYLWFGGVPGERLRIDHFPVGKHTKGNAQGVKAERPNTRVINRGRFQKLDTLDDLINALFAIDREPLGWSRGRAA